jgi:hypothetical protein
MKKDNLKTFINAAFPKVPPVPRSRPERQKHASIRLRGNRWILSLDCHAFAALVGMISFEDEVNKSWPFRNYAALDTAAKRQIKEVIALERERIKQTISDYEILQPSTPKTHAQ